MTCKMSFFPEIIFSTVTLNIYILNYLSKKWQLLLQDRKRTVIPNLGIRSVCGIFYHLGFYRATDCEDCEKH